MFSNLKLKIPMSHSFFYSNINKQSTSSPAPCTINKNKSVITSHKYFKQGNMPSSKVMIFRTTSQITLKIPFKMKARNVCGSIQVHCTMLLKLWYIEKWPNKLTIRKYQTLNWLKVLLSTIFWRQRVDYRKRVIVGGGEKQEDISKIPKGRICWTCRLFFLFFFWTARQTVSLPAYILASCR